MDPSESGGKGAPRLDPDRFEPVVVGRDFEDLSYAWAAAQAWLESDPSFPQLEEAKRTLTRAGALTVDHVVGAAFGAPPVSLEVLREILAELGRAVTTAPGNGDIYFRAIQRVLTSLIPHTPKLHQDTLAAELKALEAKWPEMFASTVLTLRAQGEALPDAGPLRMISMKHLFDSKASTGTMRTALAAVKACPVNHDAWFQLRFQVGMLGKFPVALEDIEGRLKAAQT